MESFRRHRGGAAFAILLVALGLAGGASVDPVQAR